MTKTDFVSEVRSIAETVYKNPEDLAAFMESHHAGITEFLKRDFEQSAGDRIVPDYIKTRAEADATIAYLKKIARSAERQPRAFE